MKNEICKKILIYAAGVAVGLSFIVLIVSFALLILGAVEMGELLNPYTSQIYAMYTAIALACFIVPVLASCAFAGFSNNKVFKITSAALSLVLAVLCIVFLALVRKMSANVTSYTAVSAYFIFLCVIASAAAVLAFFYMVSAVLAFKKLDVKEVDVGGGE